MPPMPCSGEHGRARTRRASLRRGAVVGLGFMQVGALHLKKNQRKFDVSLDCIQDLPLAVQQG